MIKIKTVSQIDHININMYGKYVFCRNIAFKTVHTNIYKRNSQHISMYYYFSVYIIMHSVMFYNINNFFFLICRMTFPAMPRFA